jgi:hypothetical protein
VLRRSLPDLINKIRPVADYTETLGANRQEARDRGQLRGGDRAAPRDPHDGRLRRSLGGIVPGDGLINRSVRELDSAKVAAVAERRELAAMIGTMRGQWKQSEWLGWTGIGGRS